MNPFVVSAVARLFDTASAPCGGQVFGTCIAVPRATAAFSVSYVSTHLVAEGQVSA